MIQKLLLFIILITFPTLIFSQSASSYCFLGTSGTYATLPGSPASTAFPGITATADDELSSSITLPFTFVFGGAEYTQVQISSNGWLSFGSPSISNPQNYTNNITNAGLSKPILFPLWDDLQNRNIPRYIITGSAPNRIFKVEWSQQRWNYQAGNDVISFQIWLNETTNVIQYYYNRGAGSVRNGSASIGIYDASDNYLALPNSDLNPVADATNFVSNIDIKPASGQVYTFTPPVPTSLVGTYTFCADNTVTTNTVNAGQYVLVNVIQGYNYTVSVGNAFSTNENLTILDSSDKNLSPPINATGQNGTSVSWTSSVSGQVKVLLSSSCANSGAAGGVLSLTVNTTGRNTLDDSTIAGVDKWRGHIYNYTTSAPPGGASPSPAAPPSNTPFTAAEYEGYYDEPSETITQDFGGSDVCFPVFSGGVQRGTIRTERFAVRYRMNSKRAAGCYFATIKGDDGVRLYVDGVKVFDQWQEQGATTYGSLLIYLNGNSNLIMDYYENGGQNNVEFSLVPFSASPNTITAPTPAAVCNNVVPNTIVGSAYTYNGSPVNPTIKFQWYLSTDGTVFNSISGATTQDYQPPATTTTTVNVTKWYKRTVSATASNASSCVYDSNIISIITSPAIPGTPGAITGTAVQCPSVTGQVYSVTTVPNTITYDWSLPVGWNITAGVGTASITVTTGTGGQDGNITVKATNGCGSSTLSSKAVSVTPWSAPTASVTSQPTCAVNSGTITITAPSPGSGITYSINGSTYTNTTGVFTGVVSGSYNVTAKNNSGCISAATLVNINSISVKTWTGATSAVWNLAGNWNPSGVPTASDCVIVPNVTTTPIISTADAFAGTLTINANATLSVYSAYTLTVTNEITVNTLGKLIFENHSSLMQTNISATNTGSITYKRISPKIRLADFVYWSTPVSPQKLINVSPLTLSDKYFGFDGVVNNWVETDPNTTMTVGKGYIIRGPENFSTTVKADYEASFIGVPNNGNVYGETVASGNLYLIGNPYPSGLNAKLFLDANIGFLDGTIYFWTHNTGVTLVGAYRYSSSDYAVYNILGGTATAAPSGSTPGNNNAPPSGKIAAGQSFFATANGSGTVNFNNGMRLGAVDNTQFFKQDNTSKETATSRIWLNMTNKDGAFKQMLVGYADGATNDYENRYDGISLNANPYLDFYSFNNENKYVIQGRALPFTDADIVPLGYNAAIKGEFMISIQETDGVLSNQNIYLEDKATGKVHDLTASNYTFNTAIGTFTDRFVLRYANKTLGVGDNINLDNNVLVSVKDKVIKVTSTKEDIKQVTIFDITGKLQYDKTRIATTELQLKNLPLSDQVLLVKVILENGFTTTKKIIFK